MATNRQWEISDDNRESLTLDEAKFIFEQSDKTLNDTVETSQIIVARVTTLLTLITGIIIGLVSYSISTWQKNHIFNPDIITALGVSAYSFVICIILVNNIQGRDYHITGREPIDLLINDFFTTKDIELRKIWFYLSEISANQTKIEHNKAINNERWQTFNNCLWAIAFIPLILGVLYIFSSIISASTDCCLALF